LLNFVEEKEKEQNIKFHSSSQSANIIYAPNRYLALSQMKN